MLDSECVLVWFEGNCCSERLRASCSCARLLWLGARCGISGEASTAADERERRSVVEIERLGTDVRVEEWKYDFASLLTPGEVEGLPSTDDASVLYVSLDLEPVLELPSESSAEAFEELDDTDDALRRVLLIDADGRSGAL